MPAFNNPVPSFTLELYSSTKFIVTDTTGAYHATNNPDGWGGPSGADINCAEKATLYITAPNGLLYTVETYPDLPNTTEDTFIFGVEDMLLESDPTITYGEAGAQLPDGVYTIYLDIQPNAIGPCITAQRVWVTHPYKYVLVATALRCCIASKMANIEVDCCEDNTAIHQLMTLGLLYDAMGYNACCGSLEKAEELFDQATKLCNTGDCGCN